ncbi:MAG: hypothetical protein PHV17_02910 [Candidatus Omnitrophica bacterium]|nr:hypothetical protein [Candidatus Omnitrophota bacterium]
MKKKIAIIIFSFIILIFSLFCFWSAILKVCLKKYLFDIYRVESSFQQINANFSRLSIKDLNLKTDSFEFEIARLELKYGLSSRKKFSLNDLSLDSAVLTIKNFDDFIADVLNIVNKPKGEKPVKSLAVNLNLQGIEVKVEGKEKENFHGRISLSAKVAQGEFRLIEFVLTDFRGISEKLKIGRIELDEKRLKADAIQFKEKIFSEVVVDYLLSQKILFVESFKHPFFGDAANILIRSDFTDLNKIKVKMKLSNVSFFELVELFDSKDNISANGLFSGDLAIDLKGVSVTKINSILNNPFGGFISVPNQKDILFLKDRLDKASYQALIDNFNNYGYNKGVIEVESTSNDIEVKLNFESVKRGQRNMTFYLHDFLGGIK